MLDSPKPARRDLAAASPRQFGSIPELEAELARHLARSRRQGDPMALLWLEIDVDIGAAQLGPQGSVLQALSARMQHRVRRTDFVYRVGATGFAVLLDTDRRGAQLVQARLAEQLRGPYGMDGGLAHAHVAVGMAIPSEALKQGGTLVQCAMDDVYRGRAPASTALALPGTGAAND